MLSRLRSSEFVLNVWLAVFHAQIPLHLSNALTVLLIKCFLVSFSYTYHISQRYSRLSKPISSNPSPPLHGPLLYSINKISRAVQQFRLASRTGRGSLSRLSYPRREWKKGGGVRIVRRGCADFRMGTALGFFPTTYRSGSQTLYVVVGLWGGGKEKKYIFPLG